MNIPIIWATFFICCLSSIVHLPLDERFTTRVAFLNMASLTPFRTISLPQSLLPSLKQNKDPNQIADWFIDTAQNLAVVSLEMYLYGGLIASRISNGSETEIKLRIDRLEQMKRDNPKLKIYASAVVMRIPAYDNDFQEPAYWASYGRLLYLYSYFSDKYNKTGNLSDLDKSNFYKKQVPQNVLNEFLSRRERNQNVLIYLMQRLSESAKKGNSLFQKLYITLDDNAQYGFNIAEADYLKNLTVSLNLQQKIMIYPGADEVPLTLLSKLIADYFRVTPSVILIYRNESTTKLIPNYEGEPLQVTVDNQIKAAGAVQDSYGDIILLVNNFDGPSQKQAPNQSGDYSTDYSKFTQFVCSKENIVGFVDNKYSNGADLAFVDYLLGTTLSCNRNMTDWTYAGWNTNGNTLGTVIANSVILAVIRWFVKHSLITQSAEKYCHYCTPCENGDWKCANTYFNLLRIVEDRDWQANMRQKMIAYLQEVPSDNFNHLDSDSEFYQRFAFKSFSSKAHSIIQAFGLSLQIKEVYFPWNRTFEVGISADFGQDVLQIQ